jgi:hypothetical protein
MKPVPFKGANKVFGKDQPQYSPLPAFKNAEGTVTSCWKLTWKERVILLFTGKIWLSILTFNQKLQPQKISVYNPFKNASKEEKK